MRPYYFDTKITRKVQEITDFGVILLTIPNFVSKVIPIILKYYVCSINISKIVKSCR